MTAELSSTAGAVSHGSACFGSQSVSYSSPQLSRGERVWSHRRCGRLERHQGKLLRAVLRGPGSSKAPRLPGGEETHPLQGGKVRLALTLLLPNERI